MVKESNVTFLGLWWGLFVLLILLIIKEINNEQATVALPLVKVSNNTVVDD